MPLMMVFEGVYYCKLMISSVLAVRQAQISGGVGWSNRQVDSYNFKLYSKIKMGKNLAQITGFTLEWNWWLPNRKIPASLEENLLSPTFWDLGAGPQRRGDQQDFVGRWWGNLDLSLSALGNASAHRWHPYGGAKQIRWARYGQPLSRRNGSYVPAILKCLDYDHSASNIQENHRESVPCPDREWRYWAGRKVHTFWYHPICWGTHVWSCILKGHRGDQS